MKKIRILMLNYFQVAVYLEFIFTIVQRSSTLTKVRKEKVITQKMDVLNHLRSYNFILECQFVRI